MCNFRHCEKGNARRGNLLYWIVSLALVMTLWMGGAFAGEVRVSSFKAKDDPDFCKRFARHVPEAGVNYRAGSEDVVPADVEGGLNNSVADPIRIPVEIDLLERLDLGAAEDISGIDLNPEVAAIEVFRDGRVVYNGQDISGAVKRTCAAPVPEPQDIIQGGEGEGVAPVITPSKKPASPKQKPVDPNAIDVEILEGQFP